MDGYITQIEQLHFTLVKKYHGSKYIVYMFHICLSSLYTTVAYGLVFCCTWPNSHKSAQHITVWPLYTVGYFFTMCSIFTMQECLVSQYGECVIMTVQPISVQLITTVPLCSGDTWFICTSRIGECLLWFQLYSYVLD